MAKIQERGIETELWVEFGPDRQGGIRASLYKGSAEPIFDMNKPILSISPRDLQMQDAISFFRGAMKALQWKPSTRGLGFKTAGHSLAVSREAALKKAITFMIQGINNPTKFSGVVKRFHINAVDPKSRDIAIDAETGKVTQSPDAYAASTKRTKNSIQEQAENALWVEFGESPSAEGQFGVISALYRADPNFDPKKPVLRFDTWDLEQGKDIFGMKAQLLKSLDFKPGTPEAQMLNKAVMFMLAGLANPNKYVNMVRKFHIDKDPRSKDVTVDASGKETLHPDSDVPVGVELRGTPGNTPPGKHPAKKKEALKKRAEKLTTELHNFLEYNGVNMQDPTLMGGQPNPIDTTLPIQKKNLDLLGMDIVSTPDETQDVEGAISDDTTNQAVIVFEKFNPPTRQNLKGLKEFEETVKSEGGDGFIFISQVITEDTPQEILSYKETIELLKKILKERNIKSKLVDDPNIETLTDVAHYLSSDGYKSLVICTTSDKAGEYKNELTKKNNMPTPEGTFFFEPIEVRKIDALGDSEMKDISNSAIDGDFGVFLKHIGTGDIDRAKKIYNTIRQQAV